MNKETKMYIINEEGKRIEKLIPAELYSNYIAMGWKEVEETKETKTLTTKETKLNKEVD